MMKGEGKLVLDLHRRPDNAVRKKNVNMMSAYTHVGGDTLRTLSVFVAAVVSTVSGISGILCDSWAAVVVTVTILFIVFPLASAIYKHRNELLLLEKGESS